MLKEACSQGYPESAICVQRFDDSLNSAIRITYRISLRSSSLPRQDRKILRRCMSRSPYKPQAPSVWTRSPCYGRSPWPTNSGRGRAPDALPPRSGQVEAIEVHHLGPCTDKVMHKRLPGVVTCIDLRQGPELRVRTENQIDAGAGPLDLVGRAVASLE